MAGIAIPVSYWKISEKQVDSIKRKYELVGNEIHTAWILRNYLEQSKITNFDSLNFSQRRYEVQRIRNAELLKLSKSGNRSRYNQVRKNYRKTEAYIHLTKAERIEFIREVADLIGQWGAARIFAESIDKIHYDPARARLTIDEQALEQVVTRFEHYLSIKATITSDDNLFGALIHDNNETVARNHTKLMKKFHQKGTFWRSVNRIIETPLFVDSELTSMVQLADLCSYAIRRYCENNEADLLTRIASRFDRKDDKLVGVRHFSVSTCTCNLCQ